MMPRLQAEESIRTVNQIGVGTGSLKAEDQRQLIDGWERDRRPHEKVLRIGGPLFPVPKA